MTSANSVANPKISSLFQPLQVGAVKLQNRLVMAPLTRGRAGKERIPN
ncbi:MAG: alkene reductase, partial [Cyanobacteria bacterium J06573_2]